MGLRSALTLVAVAAATVVGSVATAPAVQADPAGCPKLQVVAVPGTWETSNTPDPQRGNGMLAAVTSGLPAGTRVDYVRYAATAFPWEGEVYGASRQEAVDNARGIVAATAAACPGARFALVGYSQGADAAGDLAAEIGTGFGVVPPHRLAAVGLLSDPRRSEADILVGPPVAGNGAGGPRIGGFGFVSGDVRTFCAVGDLYCSTPKDDFVTRAAGFLAMASGGDPSAVDRYRAEADAIYLDLMNAGGLPILQSQLTEQANDEREIKLRQFYESQIHQDYSNYAVDVSGTSATTWLRNWLASKV
ncbi:cutinase [Rhodococcus rhodochrous ATCC 21198]|nr:cutinase [Rhodococcus rhodochrous ATCC 21198]